MSLTTSLNNAYSGLRASSQRAEVVSNNVSNALVENYTSKSAEVSSNRLGGVRIDGIVRREDSVATSARRLNDARLGYAEVKSEALQRVETAFGLPDSAGSLANRAADFESDLRGLANAPASIPDARAVFSSASEYANKLNAISLKNAEIRTGADAAIAQEVTRLNQALEEIEDINKLVIQGEISGRDTTVLKDERDALVDKVASIVPVNTYMRKDGAIALFTPSGGALIDGRAREFGFQQATIVTAGMSLSGGSLFGLTVDGQAVDVNSGPGYYDGGSLSAHFEMRDTTIPEIDARLDALARDLIERFQDPAVDPTLAAGDPGLFTDGGAAFDPLNELGLAGRVSVNASVDPKQGGVLSNLRDGMSSTAPLASGDNTILRNMLNALVTPVAPNPALLISSALSAPDFTAALTADIAQFSLHEDEQFAYLNGEQAILRTSELDKLAVDTDDEMQQLIAIEQAYAANARVISVVDELMQTLISI